MTRTPTPASVPPHSTTVAQPGEDEIVYFEGAPALRGELTLLACWGITSLIVIAVSIYFTWAGVSVLFALIGIPLGLALMAIPIVMTRVTRYRVTNYRIDYERGLLSKKIDTTELWHVDDIRFQQTLWQRLMGVGTVTILSNDMTTPKLELQGIPNARPIFETLKTRVIAVKRQRGVIKIDSEIA